MLKSIVCFSWKFVQVRVQGSRCRVLSFLDRISHVYVCGCMYVYQCVCTCMTERGNVCLCVRVCICVCVYLLHTVAEH